MLAVGSVVIVRLPCYFGIWYGGLLPYSAISSAFLVLNISKPAFGGMKRGCDRYFHRAWGGRGGKLLPLYDRIWYELS